MVDRSAQRKRQNLGQAPILSGFLGDYPAGGGHSFGPGPGWEVLYRICYLLFAAKPHGGGQHAERVFGGLYHFANAGGSPSLVGGFGNG